MNINELANPIKACELIINENNNAKALLNIKLNMDIDDKILSLNNGRCYYIVVNDEIYKIGYSDCKGGIMSTIRSYRDSGNTGRPSDRTHGIHVLITEQLLYENKVEVYFHYMESKKHELLLMDGSSFIVESSLSGKILESHNMEIYKKKHNNLPILNIQESGRSYPTYIQESRNRLISGTSLTIKEIKERLF